MTLVDELDDFRDTIETIHDLFDIESRCAKHNKPYALGFKVLYDLDRYEGEIFLRVECPVKELTADMLDIVEEKTNAKDVRWANSDKSTFPKLLVRIK